MSKPKKMMFKVLLEIVLLINDRGSNDLPGKELAKRCGITYNNLYIHLKSLEELKIIKVKYPMTRKRKQFNLYFLNFKSPHWDFKDYSMLTKKELDYIYKRYGFRLK
jgi:DNA-binding transcriptional ArsR family regulator